MYLAGTYLDDADGWYGYFPDHDHGVSGFWEGDCPSSHSVSVGALFSWVNPDGTITHDSVWIGYAC